MKYAFLFLSFIMYSVVMANDIKVTTGFIIQNNVVAQTIDVKFNNQDLDIQNIFTQWMEEQYNYKLDGGKIIEFNNNTLSAIGCVIPEISDQFVDLYLQVYRSKDTLTLRFFASFGFDSFITREKHPFAFRHLYAMFRNFVNDYLVVSQDSMASVQ